MSWQYEPLGSLVKITKGKKHTPLIGGQFKYINIEDLHNPENSVFTDDKGNFVKHEDLIIAWDGANAGKVGVGLDGVIGSTLAKLSINTPQIHPKFLFWFLELNNPLIKSQRTGATIPHVNGGALKDLQIPLPSLPIQKRIAEILDAADALKRKDQELLKKYDELAQAIFIDMFGDPVKNEKGWEINKCKSLFEMKLGKMLSARNYTGTHLKKYLRNVNVKWGKIHLEDVKEMDFSDNELPKYLLKKGDILVCEGGDVGRTAVFDAEGEFYYQNALHRLRPLSKNVVNATYFEYFMKLAVEKGLIDKLTISVTIKHFTLEKFRELEVIVPNYDLQLAFENKIKALKGQVDLIKDVNLFNSLIQKAFKGELVS